ncbi:recombinase family protein [Priestia megaterium]|uniref:recombinase family protein n=1 Tax=Priestia megaterium TaxID=1404 RepID=UPI00064C5B0E|nr:recombinase family protein [Priestia megaterium]KLV24256.1 resolvase [Priestia megaterium]MCE4092568.1 recombinase family protein [Priestia megaterium]
MIIGYTRPYSEDGNLDTQLKALQKYNCDKIYEEKTNSVKKRVEFDHMLASLNEGDTVIVYKFYCIADSTRHLIELIEYFSEHHIHFISILDEVNTSTLEGTIFFNMMKRVGKFQHDVISERTKAGLQEAKLKGKSGGRPKKPDYNVHRALDMYWSKKYTIAQITEATGISKTTLYRYLDN